MKEFREEVEAKHLDSSRERENCAFWFVGRDSDDTTTPSCLFGLHWKGKRIFISRHYSCLTGERYTVGPFPRRSSPFSGKRRILGHRTAPPSAASPGRP